MSARRGVRWLRWALAAVAGVVVLAVGGTYLYIHVIEGPAPAPLSLKSAAPGPSGTAARPAGAGAGSLAGTWRVGPGSQAGYRVKEVLLGQNNIAVGRTSHVTGDLVITGSTVRAATFSVAMATIHSDQSQRDAQFDGRIMDVASHPAGRFTLTSPIGLAPVPAPGVVKTYSATGDLTLHGHTQPVTFTVSAERVGGKIEVSGSIPVTFARWGIGNPSFGSFVTTQNHGVLEFLLDFTRSGLAAR